MKKIYLLLPLVALMLQSCSGNIDNRTNKEILKSVADKIIRETAFEYNTVPQKTVLNLQVLDYKNQFDADNTTIYFSQSTLTVDVDTTLLFGFDYSGAAKIFVNGKAVYEGINKNKAHLKEIAYNMFEWDKKISFDLNKGNNTILIKMVPVNAKPVFFMREIGESNLSGKFVVIDDKNNLSQSAWLSVVGFAKDGSALSCLERSYPPEMELKDEYEYNGIIYDWKLPKTNMLKELAIPETNSYHRESYIEWHYANGTTLLGMLNVADVMGNSEYSDYVSKVCSMNVANKEMLKNQFENFYALRGTNNRMFRKTMLDDTGAPALPYLQTYMKTKNEELKSLIDEMNDYVVNDQVRLDDGTFCRPEPVAYTIWADDLFMSVPFLVRMGKLTGDQKYYDDAVKQINNFNKYLYDEKAGLYKHGWFGPDNEKSKVHWGRANGWIVWAVSEALLYLPKDYEKYDEVKNIFCTFMKGIVQYQDASGMWHQVLNKTESFKETSCTAMYIIGLARGVMNGWLDQQYKENALRAWKELKTKIKEDGTVIDICRGTGIGYDYDFYNNRKRFDNDPRGLGSVLTAGAEIVKLEKTK